VAQTLTEALPYIQRFHGKTVVIKYGGSSMVDQDLKRSTAKDVVLMRYVGMNVIIVHGGGPQVSEVMRRMGKEPQFVNGLRVTDAETMQIAEMVLTGTTNKEIVRDLMLAGGHAVGISGKDGGLLRARKMEAEVDLGFVGEVEEVCPDVLRALMEKGYTVVLSTVAADAAGQSYNINADHAAGAVAAAVKAEKLISLTDVSGIMRDPEDTGSLVSRLTVEEARELLAAGVIASGMIPKVESCITAVEGGVPRAHIIDGRMPHSLLIETFTNAGIGTMIEG